MKKLQNFDEKKRKNIIYDKIILSPKSKINVILRTMIISLCCFFFPFEAIIDNRLQQIEFQLYVENKFLSFLFSNELINIQTIYSFIDILMKIIGTSDSIMVIISVIYLNFHPFIGLKLILISSITKYFVIMLQILFQAHRPFWDLEEFETICRNTYPNPSSRLFYSSFFYLYAIISFNLLKKKKFLPLQKFFISFFYIIILIALLIMFGGIYLLIPYNNETIRAVSVRGISQEYYVFKKNDILPLETYYNYINDTMTKAKSINADFISYAERAFAFNEEDKEKFINKAINFVKFFKINTLISLDIRYKRSETRSKQNMNLFIDDKGKILYEYTKHNLIPFVEFDYFPSKEPLQAINTKLGKISTVICYDINYPLFINSLSRNHLDMLIVPSWDYPGVAEFQSKEARYKAIEGGFNLIKNTANGVVIASDYKGRILSYFSGENCEDYFIVSE